MKKLLVAFGLMSVCFFASCTNGTSQRYQTSYSAQEFAQEIKKHPGTAVVLDVRTPEEFSKGHITNAVNYNWNDPMFQSQIASLSKKDPVYIYCLSGKRSAAAAAEMRSGGFERVYELEGGMMKWRSAGLPETTDNAAPPKEGISLQDFNALVNSEKTVLIDFYAEWCGPCKKMKPYLDEINADMSDKVIVIRINVDDNPTLCKELRIDEIPVLQVYKNKSMTWQHTGFIEKSEVVKQIN